MLLLVIYANDNQVNLPQLFCMGVKHGLSR
jgi:hypothetical protein